MDPTIVVSIITGVFALATTVLTLVHSKGADRRHANNAADHAEVIEIVTRIDTRLDDHIAWHAHNTPPTERKAQ